MADIQPPSFSLGLDSDAEVEPRIPIHKRHSSSTLDSTPIPNPSSNAHLEDQNEGNQVMDSEEEGEEEFGPSVRDSDPEPGPAPTRILKRLRRGPATTTQKLKERKAEAANGDDEIEDFSSDEDFVVRDANLSTQFNPVCSSSKVSLKGHGVLTSQSSSLCKGKLKECGPDASASTSLEKGSNGLMFPKLTISPLRRFQLIDSDSEEPSISEDAGGRRSRKIPLSSKEHQPTPSEQKKKVSLGKHQNEDLWEDFCPVKSFHVPTPVLDEVCNEYFHSLRKKKAAQKLPSDLYTSDGMRFHQDAIANSVVDFQQCWNLADPLPPAHHYFLHEDPRIQKLVSSRLPNFSPLGIAYNRENRLPAESVIDYMSQFKEEASKNQGAKKTSSTKGSTRGRNNSKKSNAKEAPNTSEGWVDPKNSTAIPKDAGKRRVHASGQGAGHWYTSPEGRKVFVSKSGQELTGQIAYRNYKKDNGGFRRSRKKTNTKGKVLQNQKKSNAKRKRG